MKKAEVKFTNITKKFNETVAVDNISCNFEAGTLTTILGPSGCGKTTSLRLIAGLERATEGKILIDNEDVTVQNVRNAFMFYSGRFAAGWYSVYAACR